MKSIAEHFFKQLIDWYFRKKSPFVIAMKSSSTILALMIGVGSLAGIVNYNELTFEVVQQDSIGSNLLNILFIVCVAILVLSFFGMCIEYYLNKRAEATKSVFVIEGRGLRDDDGNSLSASLPKDFPSNRTSYLLDLRQRLDGRIVEPELLVPKISAMKEAVINSRKGENREITELVYGGLTAVPLTFQTGVELDDEARISVFDWDRSKEEWRPLDGFDDGKRFAVNGLGRDSLSKNTVLAISASYAVEEKDVRTSFGMPIVRMELEGLSSSTHWSRKKQSMLADQFLETAKSLGAMGVEHIHLILAAPNSLVFNFGRRYDKRNLPDLTVYQYERSQDIKYPWGVRMPVGTKSKASIERIDHPKSA